MRASGLAASRLKTATARTAVSLLAALGLLLYAAVQARVSWPTTPGMDLAAFLGVGRATQAGQDPYGVLPTTPRVTIGGVAVAWPNANPPALLPLLDLVAPLDPADAARVWFVLSGSLYAVLLALLLRTYPARRTVLAVAWAAALVPLWYSAWLGQIYVPLALASAGAWLALERGRSALAGVLLGTLVALKPEFVVWPAALLLAGTVAPVAVAAATAIVLSALPVALFSPVVYAEWLRSVVTYGGLDPTATGSVWSIAALALVGALGLWTWRRRPGSAAVSAAAIVVSLLVSPITWHGYLLIALPVFFARRLGLAGRAAAVMMLFPFDTLVILALIGVDLILGPRNIGTNGSP